MLHGSHSEFLKAPKKLVKNYKKTGNISRISWKSAVDLLNSWKSRSESVKVLLERPMTNVGRYNAVVSGARAFEATLICLEMVGLDYEVIDSRHWQKHTIPGIKGSKFLKEASANKARELFPEHSQLINKHKDGDALLMCVWMRDLDLGLVDLKPKPKRKNGNKGRSRPICK